MGAAAPSLRLRAGGPDQEARLAHAAAAGTGRAFSALYARHEHRAFNLAFRITGSEEDAARITRDAFVDALRALAHLGDGPPSFGTSLTIATWNAGHELVELPGARGEAEEADSERDPAPDALEAQVREANFRLPVRARAVLALGELDGTSHGQIATVVDIDPGSVAGVIASARLGLHALLRGADLTADTGSSEDCEQALPLIAMRDDGQLVDEQDFEWLLEHLAHCAGCRLRLDAMQEAAAAYRAWPQIAAAPGLFRQTRAAAAQLSGADWSEIEKAGGPRRDRPSGIGGQNARVILAAIGNAGTAAAAGALGALRGRASTLAAQTMRRRPQRNMVVIAGLLLLGLSAIAAGATLMRPGNDGPEKAAPPAKEATEPAASRPAPATKPKRRSKARPAAREREAPPVPRRAVAIRPRAAPEPQRPGPRQRPPEERRSSPERRRPSPEQRAPKARLAPEQAPAPTPPPQQQPDPQAPPPVTPPQSQPAPPGCNVGGGSPDPCP